MRLTYDLPVVPLFVVPPRSLPMPDAKYILLIEDDREIASTLMGVLQSAGYNVTHAPNGVEGQRLLQAASPDL
ncbi:MAG: hypothetical protein WD176_01635, partial [Pirellulales bacterium]